MSRFHPTVGLGEKGSFVKMNTFTLQIPYKMAIYECEEQDLLDTFQNRNECEDENLPKATSVTLFCLLKSPLSVETIPILQNFVQQHQPR